MNRTGGKERRRENSMVDVDDRDQTTLRAQFSNIDTRYEIIRIERKLSGHQRPSA